MTLKGLFSLFSAYAIIICVHAAYKGLKWHANLDLQPQNDKVIFMNQAKLESKFSNERQELDLRLAKGKISVIVRGRSLFMEGWCPNFSKCDTPLKSTPVKIGLMGKGIGGVVRSFDIYMLIFQ